MFIGLLVYSAINRRICSLKSPTDLMLFLTRNACYTSSIDKPAKH